MKLKSVFAVMGLLAFSGAASAAAVTGPQGMAAGAGGASLIEKVHGEHRACEEGRYGWHRHDRYGERIPCEPRRGYHRGHDQDHGYRRGHDQDHGYRAPPPRRCNKDWHCEKSGPFGIEKRCYWREICH